MDGFRQLDRITCARVGVTFGVWKTFASLFFAVAVAMLGIGIIAPILPLYVETFSASGLIIGVIMGAFSLSRGLLGPFVGRLSDRIGRKRFLLAGLGIFALVSLCYSLAGNVWQLVLPSSVCCA